MDAKYKIIIGIAKRVALPVVIGSIVVFLMHHGYSNWADIVCDISTNLGVYVQECKQ